MNETPTDATDSTRVEPVPSPASAPRRRWRPRLVWFGVAIAVGVAIPVVLRWFETRSDDVTILDPGSMTDVHGGDPELTGKPLADVELTDSEDRPVRTTQLSDRPMVLNFWYSTCPPCRRELPAFAAVERELGDRVEFIGINPFDDAETAASFAARYGVDYTTLFDRSGDFSAAMGIVDFPTTLLVDADGTVVFQRSGEMTADALRSAIDEWLSVDTR